MGKACSSDLRERISAHVSAAALRCDGLTAHWIIDQPMTKQVFETYAETQLAPARNPGHVIILDNLPGQKSSKSEAPRSSSFPLIRPI